MHGGKESRDKMEEGPVFHFNKNNSIMFYILISSIIERKDSSEKIKRMLFQNHSGLNASCAHPYIYDVISFCFGLNTKIGIIRLVNGQDKNFRCDHN